MKELQMIAGIQSKEQESANGSIGLRKKRWVRIRDAEDSAHNGKSGQVVEVSKSEDIVRITLVDGVTEWFETQYVQPITRTEALANKGIPVDRSLDVAEAKPLQPPQENPRIDSQTQGEPSSESAIVGLDSKARLASLEQEIQTGIGLMEVGKTKIWQAVEQIRQEELWRLTEHQSFEDYIKAKWGWERSNAYEVAAAGRLVVELHESGVEDSQMPTSIAQARVLRDIDPEHRPQVIQAVLEETGGKPSANAMRSAAERLKAPIEEETKKPKSVTLLPSIVDPVTEIKPPAMPIMNPTVIRFKQGRKEVVGNAAGILVNWRNLTIAAVLVDHETGQTQVPIGKIKVVSVSKKTR